MHTDTWAPDGGFQGAPLLAAVSVASASIIDVGLLVAARHTIVEIVELVAARKQKPTL